MRLPQQISLGPVVSFLLIGCTLTQNAQPPDYNPKIENDILKNYNSKHRPVQKESTTTQVAVYLMITHIEKVDEREQTMLLHGHLWSTWTDEYLRWNASKYNDTLRINIDSYKIWQPALSLYNSARGNTWHLFMRGLPATVNSNGLVWATGSFSFHVTCMFDFSDYPYDRQECPIVIADWVYDLSRVNLSDPNDAPWNKPTVRLSYDPVEPGQEKRHVAGWEVVETWRKHCYWGPSGCKEVPPDGLSEWYWSLLEFGVRIRRHAPYFAVTVLLPTMITATLTLAAFWFDCLTSAIALLVFNSLLQGLYGWELIRQMPPGAGLGTPKIVTLTGAHLWMTTLALVGHVLALYALSVLPSDTKLPISVADWIRHAKTYRVFQVKGLSFDPQSLLNGSLDGGGGGGGGSAEQQQQQQSNQQAPTPVASISAISSSAALALPPQDESLVDVSVDSTPEQPGSQQAQAATDATTIVVVQLENQSSSSRKPPTEDDDGSQLSVQLYVVRRAAFCLCALLYAVFFLYFFI